MSKLFNLERAKNKDSISYAFIPEPGSLVKFVSPIDLSGSFWIEFELNIPDRSLLTDQYMSLFSLNDGTKTIGVVLENTNYLIVDWSNYNYGGAHRFFLPVFQIPKVYVRLYCSYSSTFLTWSISALDNRIESSSYTGMAAAGANPFGYSALTTDDNGYIGKCYVAGFTIEDMYDCAISNLKVFDSDFSTLRHHWLGGESGWNDLIGGVNGTYLEGSSVIQAPAFYDRDYEHEFLLEWWGQKGDYNQFLFKDWINKKGVDSEIINQVNDYMRNISQKENHQVTLYAEDLLLSEFQILSDILKVHKINRLLKDSQSEPVAIIPNTLEYQQNGGRFNLNFDVILKSKNLI